MKRPLQSLVTVIIPCYNAEKYLQKAVDSILNQSYKNLDILLINDGSSDRTAEILKSYGEQDDRVHVVTNERNLGLIRTLNKGIELSRGEFIARMDADDISHTDRIRSLLEMFEKDPGLDLTSAGFWFMDASDKLLLAVNPKALKSHSLKFISFFCTPVVHPCIVCKASLLKNEQFDKDYIHSEDYELFSRLLFKGAVFENHPGHLYYYRINFQSVSYQSENIQSETHVKISARNIRNYLGGCPEDHIHRIVANRMNFKPSVDQLKAAFDFLDQCADIFEKREQLSPEEMKEIGRFVEAHKLDILIQAVKKAGKRSILPMVPFLMKNVSLAMSSHGSGYLLEKLKLRSKSGKN